MRTDLNATLPQPCAGVPATWCGAGQSVGRSLRLPENIQNVPPLGWTLAGQEALRLKPNRTLSAPSWGTADQTIPRRAIIVSVILPKAYVQQAEFAADLIAVEEQLRPSVVRIRYTFGDDWSGKPAVFFNVVLADFAAARDRLLDAMTQVTAAIIEQMDTEQQWGVLPYFNFRSQSEQ